MPYPIAAENRAVPKLLPGWRIIANRPATPSTQEICDFVLAVKEEGNEQLEFCTWLHNLQDGGLSAGHYTSDWRQAVLDFNLRPV